MFHPTFDYWLHLEWLRFLSLSFIVYVTGRLSMEGAVLPALFSLWILLQYTKKTAWKHWKTLLMVEAVCILAALESLYWGETGLHTLDISFILFPAIAWLLPRVPLLLFYPLTFFVELSGDVWADAWRFHFNQGWYFGIGGAGFHDGVFLLPLETLVACVVVRYGLLGLSHLMGRTIMGEFRDEE